MKGRYTGVVRVDMMDIFLSLVDHESIKAEQEYGITAFKFEHLIEEIVRKQLPMDITLEDFTTYVGTLSSLIWMNRKEWLVDDPPIEVSVKQKPNGCFKTRIYRA